MLIFSLLLFAGLVAAGAFLVTPISGRAGRFQINGANYNVDKATPKNSTQTGEITGFEDQNGAGRTSVNRADGNDDLTVMVEGPIDAANMPSGGSTVNGTANALVVGAICTNVKIFLDKGVATRWNGSNRMIVQEVEYDVDEKGVATRYKATLQNAGGTLTNPI